ncbi:hypothetical protein CB1_000216025 [Camelus ferus]|nr:hypothetical protein CB1_000216025 [Camelus ferus]
MFLENWKRLQMRLGYFWDLTGIDEEEFGCTGAAMSDRHGTQSETLSPLLSCETVDLTGSQEHSRPEYETKVREKMLKESDKSVVQKLGTSTTEGEDEGPRGAGFCDFSTSQKENCEKDGEKLEEEVHIDILPKPKLEMGRPSVESKAVALAALQQGLRWAGCPHQNLKGKTTNDDDDKLTWRDRFPGYLMNFASILFMIALTFSIVFGVIVYRITTAAALSLNKATRSNVRVTVTATAVIINLVVILILDEIYGAVAKWLTKIEVPKTEQTFEERLILKAFLLKFVNAYSPIFYVAFFKGRFVGRPGSYVYVFDGYRMEEASIAAGCAPGGCLMELCVQLSIIMLGKQLIQNNIFEIGVPKLKKLFRKLKDETEPGETDSAHSKHPEQWDLDYSLEPYTGLTPEYMEMSSALARGLAGGKPEVHRRQELVGGSGSALCMDQAVCADGSPENCAVDVLAPHVLPHLTLSAGISSPTFQSPVFFWVCFVFMAGDMCLVTHWQWLVSSGLRLREVHQVPRPSAVIPPGQQEPEPMPGGPSELPRQKQLCREVIQFGFVTLFVASFPLAPVFALLNNVIEVRLDAKKFGGGQMPCTEAFGGHVLQPHLPPGFQAAGHLGLSRQAHPGAPGRAALAFVIAVTSDFIPRLVYQYSYSHNGTLHGFVNHTLSFFNVSQLKAGTQPENSQFDQEVQFCRFKDYREPPWAPNPYEFSKQYWSVLSARLAFVIIFQPLRRLVGKALEPSGRPR